jgi:hypothetical protein
MDYTEEFPFDQFPWKLQYTREGNETRKCYFESESHRQKHIDRYKLKKKRHQIELQA